MFDSIPTHYQDVKDWTWAQFQPLVDDLLALPLDADNIESWLSGWTQLNDLYDEIGNRAYVETSVDTTDEAAQARFEYYNNYMQPEFMRAEHQLNQKLVESGLLPAGMEIAVRRIRNGIELFREANLPLLSAEQNLTTEYNKVIGAQTVEWEGEQLTLQQLAPVLQELDRERREYSWCLAGERMLADRDALNDIWLRFLDLRRDIAANSDMPDYRAYKWKEWNRFDYTPDDALAFFAAIHEVVAPAYGRVLERRKRAFGLDTLRPWDTEVDIAGRQPLRPFSDVATLQDKTIGIFQAVDPELADYTRIMRDEGYFDLDNRANKAPGRFLHVLSLVAPPLHLHECGRLAQRCADHAA